MKKAILTSLLCLVALMASATNGTFTAQPGKGSYAGLTILPRPASLVMPDKVYLKEYDRRRVPNGYIYDQKDGTTDIYASLYYDERFRTFGWVKFNTDAPENYTLFKDYGQIEKQSYFISAATYVGDKLYAFANLYYGWGMLVPAAIGTISEDGTFTKLADLPAGYSTAYTELAYDEKNNMLIGNGYNENTEDESQSFSQLYTINTTTGAVSELSRVNELFFGVSAENGYLYAIARRATTSQAQENSGHLLRVATSDIVKGGITSMEEVGTGLDMDVYYLQSMEIDKSTHKLWWAGQTYGGTGFIAEVSLTSGQVLSQKPLVANAQLVALNMPYQTAADDAPSFVGNFKVVAGEQGAMEAKLSWTAPTETYRNAALSGVSGYKVYRNGTLIATLGADALSYTDNTVTVSDFYTYRIQAYNAAGDGLYKEQRSFVGRDVPGKVAGLTLKGEGAKATLTWTSPAMGAHGGYYDPSSLTYTITRKPDNVVVSQGKNATTFTETLTTTKGYSYLVKAVNADGEGEEVESNIVAIGDGFSIPFESSLTTKDEFNLWTAYDANKDGNTWGYSDAQNIANYTYTVGAANDYLISPKLIFEGGKKYQLRYTS